MKLFTVLLWIHNETLTCVRFYDTKVGANYKKISLPAVLPNLDPPITRTRNIDAVIEVIVAYSVNWHMMCRR